MIYCYYHKVDWDGHSAAAVIKHFVPDAVLKPFNYDMEFPLEEVTEDDTVYFVDISLPISTLLELCSKVKKVIVIDHHASFIKEVLGNIKRPENLTLFLDPTLAGCELAWLYCGEGHSLGIPPRSIRLLGQYDAWRNFPDKMKVYDVQWDDVMAFQYGMRKFLLDSDFFRENIMFEQEITISDILTVGESILGYQDTQNQIAMKWSFDRKIEGYKCLCLNTGLRNSQVFMSKWDPEKYDIMLPFSYDGDKWSYSAYSTKAEVDCGEFAKKFGGGGHKGAAGFVTSDLILLKTRILT
jgi:nanoRNase/pAp phosphatase (c-di-AMP/oligoRNAs hydrolase)